MSKIVGIDLGTTNSLVAVVDSGIPYVLADREGRRLTPSVVQIAGGDQPPLVGHVARRGQAARPRETIYSVKRFMGRRGNDVGAAETRVNYPVSTAGQGPVTFPMGGREWLPEEISALILRKLKADAEAALGEPVGRAVITVPAYFNDAQRQATVKAGEMAGFTVERIVNEPTAAALAYGLGRLRERSKVAVYDLGGGTFDLSILELNEGTFQVLATHGNTRLGGDDLDRCVVDHLLVSIRDAGGPDLTGVLPRDDDPAIFGQLARVREAAEAAKIQLSTETTVTIALPFLTPAFSFELLLRREQLEQLTCAVIDETRVHCQRSLADARLEFRDLDQVILVGGQTRMPLVRRKVAEWFGCAEFDEVRGGVRVGEDFHSPAGPVLNTSQNPDEAVALGAAIQAEILAGGFRNLLLLDVTPLSLGLETFGGLMNVIIPRNTTIPVKAGEMFTTAVDFQRSMLIHVLQGERERACDNWSLGRFELEFGPAARGVPRIGVQFEIDANGILHVLARDTKTGREQIVAMNSAVDVNDADVQRMVEESVEHAFSDLRARRWIEGSLRAREVVTATRKTMAQYVSELDPEYQAQLTLAVGSVEAVLATVDAAGVGDPERLKVSVQALDEATRPLAEHAMNQVMEAVLRRRGLVSTDVPPA